PKAMTPFQWCRQDQPEEISAKIKFLRERLHDRRIKLSWRDGGLAEVEGLLDLMERNYSDWANFLAPKVMQNTDHPELTSELTASFLSTDMTIMRQFAEVAFFADYRHSLPQATVPAYILQASSDMIVPDEVALYMHHHIPVSILHMMQAHGHYPQLSAPVEITGLIRAYLEQS
ncbi:MAG: hypothetical protein HGA19_17270, partial [Oscillochloris sp.]|nr:hypothetical protein [Oscillochloris sp.]